MQPVTKNVLVLTKVQRAALASVMTATSLAQQKVAQAQQALAATAAEAEALISEVIAEHKAPPFAKGCNLSFSPKEGTLSYDAEPPAPVESPAAEAAHPELDPKIVRLPAVPSNGRLPEPVPG